MAYQVTLQPGGSSFTVEAGEPVLDAALRAGCHIPYGCRNGTCGSCAGRLLAGEFHYPQGLPPGLSPLEAESGRVLLCQARARSDLTFELREIRMPPGIEVRTLPARVVSMQRLADDVMRLYLKLPASEDFRYLAGQYVDILLRGGGRRGFSIANRPGGENFIELHVRFVPGGEFTSHVFAQMKERAILRVEGPLGTFFVRDDSSRPLLMMGGGTGFAPLKAMLEQLYASGPPTRPVHLYWGARHRAGLYLHEQVEGWVESRPGLRYTPVLSEPLPADHWHGRTGWVHEALAADYPDLSGFEVYMSGPPAMIRAARERFAAQGLPADQMYFDSFDFAHEAGEGG